MSERKVQQAVQNLRLQHHLILAAVERPFGYFIAQTQDEIVDYTMSLMSRAVKELKVVSLLRRETLRMVFDQAVLNQEGEP